MPDDAAPLLGTSARVPPSAVEAEQAVLGSLLSNNPRTADRCQFLKPEHFADPVNGKIFERAMQRIRGGLLADAVTLKTDFENTGVLEEYGGTRYLAQLLTANIGWMATRSYAQAIYDTWLRRQLIDASAEIMETAYGTDPANRASQMVSDAAEVILALGEHSSEQRGTDFKTVAAGAVARSEAALKGVDGHKRLDTGIPAVDRLWGGLWPGELYYLMARSRTGKTPFMMQIARHVAAQLAATAEMDGKPPEHVHVFSLEMTADGLLTTNLASTTRWSADQIKSGEIDDWLEYDRAAKRLGALPIAIDDQADMDIAGLALRARAVKRQRRTRLICIDYRELVRRGRDQVRMQLPEWIPYLGYQLKALAKTLNVPVIALAQINKAKSGDGPVRPTLDDLPYDGGQAADGVFALHRPELAMAGGPNLPMGLQSEKAANIRSHWEEQRKAVRGLTEFMALKRRFGPTGSPCRLRFDGPRMLLSEWLDEPPPDLLEGLE